MKKQTFIRGLLCFFFLLGTSLIIAPEAESAPAFARQTGMSCNTCHFQHFPTLNSVGRAFKASGFTMVGGQSMVEGELLSMPVSLNASVILKIRGKKTNGRDDSSGKNKGIVEFPDEGALLFGGKIGEKIGFILETQLKSPDDSAWASFKMPINITDIKGTSLSVIPFTTDGAGPAYGFELLNTGAYRIQRPIEDRKAISAQQYLGTGDRNATGLALVAANSKFFINYTPWSPEHGTTDAGPYLHYLRAAITPTIGSWDIGAGFQIWNGNTNYSDPVVTTYEPTTAGCTTGCSMKAVTTGGIQRVKAEAWAIDAQAQGKIGKFPLGVYVSYGEADKSDSQRANLFNSNTKGDRTAAAIMAQLGIMPEKLTLSLGYIVGDTGDTANNEQITTTLAATYTMRQNVTLQINQSFMSGDYYSKATEPANGDQQTMVLISAAF